MAQQLSQVALSETDHDNLKERATHLLSILSYCRPHGSDTEAAFVRLLVDSLTLFGHTVDMDGFGNRWVTIEPAYQEAQFTPPKRVLWSCHVDTMHAKPGRQSVRWQSDGRTLELSKRKPGRVLGADDGAGVFILREMILAGVPGTYVFHRGEERGRLGSLYVEEFEAERLEGFDACVAFDRRGKHDIITHQMSERGASESFAESISKALWKASDGRLDYWADDGGSYTDSYTYFRNIPECTNLAVGYSSEHGQNETLDVEHVLKLRDAMVRIDLSSLVIERDPTTAEYLDWMGGYHGYGKSYGGGWLDDEDRWQSTTVTTRKVIGSSVPHLTDTLEDLCLNHPEVAARLLEALGISSWEFIEEIYAANPSRVRSAVA